MPECKTLYANRTMLISGYRSHTQAVAKGIPVEAVFAEIFGKVDGCSRGKGGSMHMFSAEKRFLGGHGIVGGQAPLATGVGFSIRYRKEDDVIVLLPRRRGHEPGCGF